MLSSIRNFAAAFVLAVSAIALPAFAADDEQIVIDQSRGVDQALDYQSLVKLGPWDDRNYQLRKADVAIVPVNDRYYKDVPAFFKVLKRKEMIEQGFPLDDVYPREFNKEFQMRFGGLLQNGVLKRKGLGIYTHPDPNNPPEPLFLATDPIPHAVPVEGQGPFDSTLSDNETSIEYNPVNPNILIAGSNGSGGQRQAFSTDGGVSWTATGALPSTCCDPAMDWSPNGAFAYTATLGTGGGCGFSLCTQIYSSDNNGATWLGPVNVSTASSDKEFIHVDKSPTSPFFGKIYVTWHQGNVMQFVRSTNETPGSLAFATPVSFAAEERGIGSDITTDEQGRIYYVYPSLTTNSAEIRVLRSTDGGATFTPSVQVYDLWGRFDFSIPSMETRRAFIYVAADVDMSGGPNDGRVYVAFTDKHPSSPPEDGGTAAQNHGWIRVAYSDNQGATWQVATTPHSEADIATVDRYHPWLDVDDNGVVHIAFYDTRNSVNRTGVDYYYAFSADGGTTWIEETRVSDVTSVNINDQQEWGDYNGLSASVATTIAMTWTDNRNPGPVQASYVGRVTNVSTGPTYVMGASDTSLEACAGSPVPQTIISLSNFNGYTNPVALSTPGLNVTVFPTATFGTNPVTPPGTSTFNMTTSPTAAAGTYPVVVRGTGPGPNVGDPPITRDINYSVRIDAPLAGAPAPSTPANGATDQVLRPTLVWSALAGAGSYTVELATDAGFTNIIATSTQDAPDVNFQPAGNLNANTQYFWRVRATNGCGTSANSATFSFRTANLICSSGPLAIPDNGDPAFVQQDIVIPAGTGTVPVLRVSMTATHTWVGDLDIRLQKVGGPAEVILLDNPVSNGNCRGDNFVVLFEDSAPTTAQATCIDANPAISGSQRPFQPFTAYNNIDLAGTWRVRAQDTAAQDVGTIDSWCIVAPAPDPDTVFSNGFE